MALTAVQPPGRYGVISLDGHLVGTFDEKPSGDGSWINGGFFVLEPSVIDLIPDDSCNWERQPLQYLASIGQLTGVIVIAASGSLWIPSVTVRD